MLGKHPIRSLLNESLSLGLCGLLLFQLAACGTLLYPERRDQKGGQVDVAVVLMDAIGLIFFIIPGVIAFAVDFSTGAIYLPSSSRHSRNSQRAQYRGKRNALSILRIDPKNLDPITLSRIVTEQTGVPFRLDDPRLRVIRPGEPAEIEREWIRVRSEKRGTPGRNRLDDRIYPSRIDWTPARDETKSFPSPGLPVRAAILIASMARSTSSSSTTTINQTFASSS